MQARVRYARTSDGVDIAYAVHGSGPPLVAVRPLMRPGVDDELAYQMDPARQKLSEHHAVVIWDPRGFGLSSADRPRYTLESSVLDLKAVGDALGAPFDLMAELTPAHTAIAFAARHPERVNKLVLRNPSEGGMSPRKTTFAEIPDISREHFAAYAQLLTVRVMGWGRGDIAKRYYELLVRRFDGDSWNSFMESMEQIDAAAEASSVRAPALLLADVTSPEWPLHSDARLHVVRKLAASFPNGELVVLKQGGRAYAEVVEEFLDAAERRPDAAQTSSGTAVILFADIVDSTALTERLGDAAFRERARTLDDALRAAITAAGGTAIDGKLLGDGVLATFSAASQAIDAALRCATAGHDGGLPLHLGIHAGDVIREQNNVYGGAVNIASRISALSAPGEVLVSDTVRSLARTSAGVTFDDRGEHALKGVADPQRVYAVRAEGA